MTFLRWWPADYRERQKHADRRNSIITLALGCALFAAWAYVMVRLWLTR